MKDYSAYIVPAFAITALVFAFLVWNSLAHARRWKKLFEARSARTPSGK